MDYAPLSDEQRRRLRSEHLTRYRAWFEKKMTALRNASSAPRGEEKPPQEPTRLTLSLEQNTYRFGAITAEASIPEREVTLDRALVATANDELAGESDRRLQVERGRLMEGLLLPKDLRPHLRSQAPLVLLLDATTARIHWEMVAQPELPGLGNDGGGLDGEESLPFRDAFLGTARGLTRQLRTTFSQAPEPPPPRRRVLRVLIVADPAEDAHLPGAEEEGAAVADLFESFNSLYHDVPDNRVDVTRLFGPRDATRTNVLRRIMLDRYDVLHFAGHCFFDREDPAGSGWVFSDGGILSARELRRLDRIPGFVFSNACESGITPDRSEKRSVNAAPSFAEAFFERGVANFVVTAWPVDDRAAQRFARRLYADLLGIRMNDARERSGSQEELARCTPLPMFQAMRNARLEIAETPNGARTWGAYQHYGSPYFRFFDERALRPKPPEEATRAGARKATPRPAKPKGRTRKKSPSKSRGKRS